MAAISRSRQGIEELRAYRMTILGKEVVDILSFTWVI